MSSIRILRIEVLGLFDEYDYVLPRTGHLPTPAILYGDNGVGKSTILKLLFHLLSPADDRGHRTAIRKIPFRKASVDLDNGFTLVAEKEEANNFEDVELSIWRGGVLCSEWNYSYKRSATHLSREDLMKYYAMQLPEDFADSGLGNRILSRIKSNSVVKSDGVKRGEIPYLQMLSECVPEIYLIGADRHIESDALNPSGDISDYLRAGVNTRVEKIVDLAKTSRNIALESALENASRWVQGLAVRSTNVGSTNVHNVYEQVLRQLANDYGPLIKDTKSDLAATLKELDDIEERTKELSKYELTTELDMGVLRDNLEQLTDDQNETPVRLIEPYLKSVKSRLSALDPIYQTLSQFVSTVSSFLFNKELRFSLSGGFQIYGRGGVEINTASLSSGEQQLLLLFCYALTARDNPSVFIIDEPEISLNIKWQRKIITSLLEVAGSDNTQFIFASHSMELISQHRDSVVTISP